MAGTSRMLAASPDSCMNATSSSMKNGLPPLRSRSSVTSSGSASPSSSARTSSPVACASSGSSCSVVALYLPGSGFQRVSMSGRAVATSRNGKLRRRVSSRSQSSSVSSEAQCRSESDEHERHLLRERFEEHERRAQRLVARAARVDAGPADALGEEQQSLDDPFELGGIGVGAEHAARLLGDALPDVGLAVGLVEAPTLRGAPRRSGRTGWGRRTAGTRR